MSVESLGNTLAIQKYINDAETAQSVTKEELQQGMMMFSGLSQVPRLIAKGVEAICNDQESTKTVCKTVGQWINDIEENTKNLFLSSLPLSARHIVDEARVRGEKLPAQWEQQYGISQEDTRYAFESFNYVATGAAIGSVGSILGKVAQAVGKIRQPVFKLVSKRTIQSGRGDPISYIEPIIDRAQQSSSSMGIADRINSSAEGYLHFPTMDEVRHLPVKDAHAIWSDNQQTLVGWIAENEIPHIGLHGTTKEGLKAIQKTHISRSKDRLMQIYIASRRYSLDPITDLADFHAIVRKVQHFEGQKGGILVVDATTAAEHVLPILDSGFFPRHVAHDTVNQRKFIDLIGRHAGNNFHEAHLAKIDVLASGKLMTLYVDNTYEYLLHFNPKSYSSVVKGVIKETETIYPAEELNLFVKRYRHFREANPRNILAKRFKDQEVIVGALEKFGFFSNPQTTPWRNYHQMGKELMNKVDEITQIMESRLAKLKADHFEKDRKYFDLNAAINLKARKRHLFEKLPTLPPPRRFIPTNPIPKEIGKRSSVTNLIRRFLKDDSGKVLMLPTKKPAQISSKEMIHYFERAGFKVVSGGKGSHTKMQKTGFPMVIVPMERELPRGTVNNLWKILQKAVSTRSTAFSAPLITEWIRYHNRSYSDGLLREKGTHLQHAKEEVQSAFLQLQSASSFQLNVDQTQSSIVGAEMCVGTAFQLTAKMPINNQDPLLIGASREVLGAQTSLSLTPSDPQNFTFGLGKNLGDSAIGMSLVFLHPKETALSGSTSIYGVTIGGQLNSKHPEKSSLSAAVPLYGIPVGISAPLNHLEKAHLFVGVSLPSQINDAVKGMLGVKLPPLAINVSAHSVARGVKHAVHSIKKAFGFRKKRKDKHPLPPPLPAPPSPLTLLKNASKDFHEQIITLQKNVGDLSSYNKESGRFKDTASSFPNVLELENKTQVITNQIADFDQANEELQQALTQVKEKKAVHSEKLNQSLDKLQSVIHAIKDVNTSRLNNQIEQEKLQEKIQKVKQNSQQIALKLQGKLPKEKIEEARNKLKSNHSE